MENLTNLENLSLFSNKLEGEIPKEIGNLTNLKWLNLSNNNLEKEIPKKIQELKCATKNFELNLDRWTNKSITLFTTL